MEQEEIQKFRDALVKFRADKGKGALHELSTVAGVASSTIQRIQSGKIKTIKLSVWRALHQHAPDYFGPPPVGDEPAPKRKPKKQPKTKTKSKSKPTPTPTPASEPAPTPTPDSPYAETTSLPDGFWRKLDEGCHEMIRYAYQTGCSPKGAVDMVVAFTQALNRPGE